MQQRETGPHSTPTHPTLASVPHIRAEMNAKLARRYPTVGVDVADRGAPGGVLHYAIAPMREPEGVRYGLYYEGHHVPYPHPLLARHQRAFARQLGQVDPRLVARMYRDMGVGRQDMPVVYARVAANTPRPERHSFPRPPIAVVGRDDTRERKTPRLLSSSLPDRMESALAQMRVLIANGTIQVKLLENKGGYYANILDRENGQLHQVGYSFSKDLPWHVVFQLKDGVDIVYGAYRTPKPHITRGKVRYDRSHKNYMRQVGQKEFDPKDTSGKDAVREALGFTGSRRGHLYAVRQPIPGRSYPSSPSPQASEPPEWMHPFTDRPYDSFPPVSQPRTAVMPTPTPHHAVGSGVRSSAEQRGGTPRHIPSGQNVRRLSPDGTDSALRIATPIGPDGVPAGRVTTPPRRLSASDLIDPKSFPGWLREGDGSVERHGASQASARETRQIPPARRIPHVNDVRAQIHNLRPSLVTPAPIIGGQYPYELVQFGGYAGIHTSHAFV